MNAFDKAIQGLAYLEQIALQHDICTACLKIVSKQDSLEETIKVILHQKHHFQPEKTKVITTALIQSIIAEAKQAERNEFSLLCRNTLVALCGGLECLVKDVVAASILENENLQEKIRSKAKIKLKLPLVKGDEEGARVLVDSCYKKVPSEHGHTRKFLLLLEDGGIVADGDVQLTIDEAFAVRNVIVHHGSKVDKRLKSKFPNIQREIGDFVDMSAPVFQNYRKTIIGFAGSVSSFIL